MVIPGLGPQIGYACYLKRFAISPIVPSWEPDWLMLIERLYYYRGCYYTSSTVCFSAIFGSAAFSIEKGGPSVEKLPLSIV